MSIIIFSRPIHSGKTTELLQWCNQQKNVYGILMPDIDGSRKILDLHTRDVFEIECKNVASANESLTSVGRFHFYTTAFEKANMILSLALEQNPNWLVIDEVGKLELDGKGFHDAIIKSVAFYATNNGLGNLLLTVRDSLCADVIDFFKLKDCKIIQSLENIGLLTSKKNPPAGGG